MPISIDFAMLDTNPAGHQSYRDQPDPFNLPKKQPFAHNTLNHYTILIVLRFSGSLCLELVEVFVQVGRGAITSNPEDK